MLHEVTTPSGRQSRVSTRMLPAVKALGWTVKGEEVAEPEPVPEPKPVEETDPQPNEEPVFEDSSFIND